jgi:uncharacterized RDD family membrane protein YckC
VIHDGRYAGIVTRCVAFLLDLVVIAALFALAGALLEYLLGVLLGHDVAFRESSRQAEVVLGVWAFVALAVPLAVGGRTFGMGVVGLRAVDADGHPLGAGRALLRTLLLPLSFALAGLGFALIALRTDRRALHDLLARSAIVYSTKPRTHATEVMDHAT